MGKLLQCAVLLLVNTIVYQSSLIVSITSGVLCKYRGHKPRQAVLRPWRLKAAACLSKQAESGRELYSLTTQCDGMHAIWTIISTGNVHEQTQCESGMKLSMTRPSQTTGFQVIIDTVCDTHLLSEWMQQWLPLLQLLRQPLLPSGVLQPASFASRASML